MATVTYVKSCKCKGSSSGPRFVVTEPLQRTEAPGKDAYEFGMTLVGMACDLCDAPWVVDR